MNLSATKDETKFTEFTSYESPQPLELKEQSPISLIENNKIDYKNILKKIASNLSIFLGVLLTYGSSSVIFNILFNDALAHFLLASIYILIGSFLTFLGVGKIRNNWKIYFVAPLFSFLLSIIFTLAPDNWQGRLFGIGVMLFYPLALSIFYGAKEYLESIENKLK